MTAEQLQAARAAHWRQNQSPILTLDDAESWLQQHPLCLFLPRRAQLPAPAPSFVEACMGNAQATPGAAAIEQALGLMTRLIAQGSVVALNLLGGVSEQPDFLAHSQALPYVLCLRGDSDWKHAPEKSSGHKVSPLVLELWKALDKEGVLSAAQAKELLGRELTEAAVLRALCELWQALRISPVFADPGQPARWELLRVRHRGALSTASATSQVTALSLLVSMYLQSVYAASSEEIEVFLSPVASRSRVREAVRGLSATRQIHSLSMDAQTYYFLEAGLPEFAELPPATRTEQPRTEQPRAVARVEVPRRPLPAPQPMQRSDQAAKPARPAPPAASPFGGRAAPLAGKDRAESKPAQPGARTDGKGPRRPAAPGRSSWQPGVKPAASGGRWPARAGASGPPLPAGRSSTPADRPRAGKFSNRPRRPEGAPGGGARPDSRGGARPEKRPGAWAGAQKRERPAPWVRPAQGAGSAPRPPHAGGRGDSPFRPAQKPRPSPRTGSGRDMTPGRPPGSAAAANRPPTAGRPSGRAAVPFRSNAGRSGPPRGGRPPARSGPPRRPGSGPGANYDRPRSGGYAKPGASPASDGGDKATRPASAPGSRPQKSWPRPGTSSGKPSGGPGGRPGGRSSGRPGGRPGGKAGGKGKPPGSFSARKPARKKPGA